MNELLDFWKRYNPHEGTFLHQEDEFELTSEDKKYFCFDYNGTDERIFHADLRPEPFYGDLQNAKIYLLSLNPSFDIKDYEDNKKVEYINVNKETLNQDFSNLLADYKFPWLNPKYRTIDSKDIIGPVSYWSSIKLKEKKRKPGINIPKLIEEIAKKYNGLFNEEEISKNFAANFCVLEMFPYHSKQASNVNNLKEKLKSSRLAKEYFKNVLVEKAKKGEAIVIIIRQCNFWNCEGSQNENIVIYPIHLRQSGSIGPNTLGGKKILEFYKEKTDDFTKLL